MTCAFQGTTSRSMQCSLTGDVNFDFSVKVLSNFFTVLVFLSLGLWRGTLKPCHILFLPWWLQNDYFPAPALPLVSPWHSTTSTDFLLSHLFICLLSPWLHEFFSPTVTYNSLLNLIISVLKLPSPCFLPRLRVYSQTVSINYLDLFSQKSENYIKWYTQLLSSKSLSHHSHTPQSL